MWEPGLYYQQQLLEIQRQPLRDKTSEKTLVSITSGGDGTRRDGNPAAGRGAPRHHPEGELRLVHLCGAVYGVHSSSVCSICSICSMEYIVYYSLV